MVLRLSILLLLLALGSAPAQAQVPPLVFEHLTVEDGLSQATIHAIFQDAQGFLWFATGDGLNRYDGYEVTVYKHDPDDANSLPGNAVTALHESRAEPGVLWVGTHTAGLSRFDRQRGTFTNYPFEGSGGSLYGTAVTALFEDRAGTLWAGTDAGLHRLDRAANAFVRYEGTAEDDHRGLSDERVTALLEDREGTLWVGTLGGLNRYDPETGAFAHFHPDPAHPRSLGSDAISTLFEDAAGTLWVGTHDAGLYRYDPATEDFDAYREDRLGSDHVMGLGEVPAEPGVLWVGTYGAGLARLDPEEGSVAHYRHDPGRPTSIGQDRVGPVYGDRSGVLWAGTAFAGASRANISGGSFAHFAHDPDDPNSLSANLVWRIYEDSEGIVWVGTGTGLDRIDRAAGTVTRYAHDPKNRASISHSLVRAVLEEADGTLWFGSPGGLDRYDRRTGRFSHYEPLKLGPGQAVMDLVQDPAGHLWVAIFGGGLVRLDPATGAQRRYRHDPDDPFSLSSNRITRLYQTRDATLWVATSDGGVNRFDGEEFKRYMHTPGAENTLSHNFVSTIHEATDGTLWFGTYAGGLNCLHPETGAFLHYTEQNSDLPTNTVNGILEDDEGHLWLSTHNGLVRFDPRTEAFRVYDVDHRGLQSSEFNGGAYFKSPSGELFFGGINGFNAFFPEQITDNPTPPQVVITEMKIRNEPVVPGTGGPLDVHVSAAEAVELDHRENDISFDFVGLHYAASAGNRYAYRLAGYDEDWRAVGRQRTATYTNLPPGRYTFEVRAASNDGRWSDVPASLGLTVHPPWWRTPWAYVLYALLLVAGVVAVDRVQRRRVIARERARAEIREAQLQAEAAEAQALVLRVENERKSRELEEARQLQLSMLPDVLPDHPDVAIAAFMKTATEVGGDYYDFHVDDDGTLTLAIGDATGHGANAGTMVTATKSLFNVLAAEEGLVAMLTKASQALRRLGLPKLYMALALARLQGRRLELAGAGMPPALVYRAATGGIEAIPLKGMPLGGFADFPYRAATLDLAPGDTVLLMSDGFPEMFDAGGAMFGYERTRAVFAEVAEQPPQAIVDHFAAVSRSWAYTGLRDDDITFIVLKAKERGDQGLASGD